MAKSLVDALRYIRDLDHSVLNAHIDSLIRSGESGEGREEPEATTDAPYAGASQRLFMALEVPELGDYEIHLEIWSDHTEHVSLVHWPTGVVVDRRCIRLDRMWNGGSLG